MGTRLPTDMETRRVVAVAAGAVLLVPAVAAGSVTDRPATGAALSILALLVAGSIDAAGPRRGYVTAIYAGIASVPLLALAASGYALARGESPLAMLAGSVLVVVLFSPVISVLVAAFATAGAVGGAVGGRVRGVEGESTSESGDDESAAGETADERDD